MKTILFSCMLCLSLMAFTQNPHLDFKVGVKLGTEMSFLKWNRKLYDPQTNITYPMQYSASFLQLVPSVLWRGKSAFFNELSISNAQWKRDLFVYDNSDNLGWIHASRYFGAAAKYGKFFAFMHKRDHKVVPMLGAEIATNISYSRLRPVAVGNAFRQSSIGATFFLTPRVAWFPTQRLFLDFSWEIQAYKATYIHRKEVVTNDPVVLVDGSGRLAHNIFRVPIYARLSVGVKL
jgi:hypothetical protein